VSYDLAGNKRRVDHNYNTIYSDGRQNNSSNSSAVTIRSVSNGNASYFIKLNNKATTFSSFSFTQGNEIHGLSTKSIFDQFISSTESNMEGKSTNEGSSTKDLQTNNYHNLESSYQSTTTKEETTTFLNVNGTRKEILKLTIHQRKQHIENMGNTLSNGSHGQSTATKTSLQGVNNQSTASVANADNHTLEGGVNNKTFIVGNLSTVNNQGHPNLTMRVNESLLNDEKNNSVRVDNHNNLETKKSLEIGSSPTTSAPREITAVGFLRSPNLTNVEMDRNSIMKPSSEG
jgi:hypothetical protein